MKPINILILGTIIGVTALLWLPLPKPYWFVHLMVGFSIMLYATYKNHKT